MSVAEMTLAIGFVLVLFTVVFAHHKYRQRRASNRAKAAFAAGGASSTSQSDGAACDAGMAASGACDGAAVAVVATEAVGRGSRKGLA